MRAATVTAPRQLGIENADLRPAAAGEVVIDVGACGICGSNLHEWRHPERGIGPGGRPAPGASGHEVVGRVVERGEGVGLPLDARVVVEPNLAQSCGTCAACERGEAWFCRERTPVTMWGFADRMVIPARAAFAVPDGLTDAAATLAEPMGCAMHALRGTALATAGGGRVDGVTVAVLGAGVAGLLVVLAARHLGAGRVVVTARYDHQAQAARRCGAHDVVDAGAADVRERLRDLGPAIVVEAVGGTADTFDLAVRTVAPGGEVVVLGIFDEPQSLDVRRAVFRELRLSFPVTYSVRDGVHDVDLGLQALATAPDVADALVSHRFPLEQIQDAFVAAADKRSQALRVVVQPERTTS